MLKNYFIVTIREFKKKPLFVLISTLGLSLSLASIICISLFIDSELSYDDKQTKDKHVFRLGMSFNASGIHDNAPVVPGGWTLHLAETLPVVVNTARSMWSKSAYIVSTSDRDRLFVTENIRFVDPDYLKILNFEFIRGSVTEALKNSDAIVINQSTAQKLFEGDAVGQTLIVEDEQSPDKKTLTLTISGVFKDIPKNSHLRSDMLINIHALKQNYDNPNMSFDSFINTPILGGGLFESYVECKSLHDSTQLKAELKTLAQKLYEAEPNFAVTGMNVSMALRNVRDLHFDKSFPWEIDERGNKKILLLLSITAFLIALMSGINYTNLTTVRVSDRLKEIGIRKTFGGLRADIRLRFGVESAFVAGFTMLGALLIMIIILPAFNDVTGKSFTLFDLLHVRIAIVIACIYLVGIMVIGNYHAFSLSNLRPSAALKGLIGDRLKLNTLRKFLVAFQYTISFILIIYSIFIMRQMSMFLDTDINKESGQVLVIRYKGIAPLEKYDFLKKSLMDMVAVEDVAIANRLPRNNVMKELKSEFYFPGIKEVGFRWTTLNASNGFDNIYNLTFLTRHSVESKNFLDSGMFVLNESAVKELGITNEQAIGIKILNPYTKVGGTVSGVIKDFPLGTIYEPIVPLVLSSVINPDDHTVYVKLVKGNTPEQLEIVKKKWAEVFPQTLFDYKFLNQDFNSLYKAERKFRAINYFYTGIALFITLLGVFALTSYIAEKSRKSNAIRKTVGASDVDVILILFKSFAISIALSFLIAAPVSYYLVEDWLNSFPAKVHLDPLVFIFSFLIFMAITLMIILFELLRSSYRNITTSLRIE